MVCKHKQLVELFTYFFGRHAFYKKKLLALLFCNHLCCCIGGEQTWSYKAKDAGPEVKMNLTSTVPGKALAVIADNFMVEKLIANAFKHSLENMKLFYEAQ